MKNIRAIRTEADYDWALAEIERYFLKEPEPGTPAAERFDVLAALIDAYEAKHWPIEPADPSSEALLVDRMPHAQFGQLSASPQEEL